MSSGEDKEKLEEEIWRQAEESLRQELTDQIQKESKEKMKEVQPTINMYSISIHCRNMISYWRHH